MSDHRPVDTRLVLDAIAVALEYLACFCASKLAGLVVRDLQRARGFLVARRANPDDVALALELAEAYITQRPQSPPIRDLVLHEVRAALVSLRSDRGGTDRDRVRAAPTSGPETERAS